MCDTLAEDAYIDQVLGDGRGWAIPESYSIVDPYLLVFSSGASGLASTCGGTTRPSKKLRTEGWRAQQSSAS